MTQVVTSGKRLLTPLIEALACPACKLLIDEVDAVPS